MTGGKTTHLRQGSELATGVLQSHLACTSVTYRPLLSPLRTTTDGVFGEIWLQEGSVGPELDSVESCVLFENKLGGEEWDGAVQLGIAAKA